MDATVRKLREYFAARTDLSFALLFGSCASGRRHEESDIDIAVYFREEGSELDLESAERRFPGEDAIWSDVERIAGIEVDLIVLNRAPATIAAAAVIDGKLLACADAPLLRRFSAASTLLAEDERRFAESFLAIKARSSSLSDIDRDRLVRIVDFIESELSDSESFSAVTRMRCFTDAAYRRNAERWIENFVNASIDVAKIALASRKRLVPQTYREALLRLSEIEGYSAENCEDLAAFSKLRNLLAHEYLDLRNPAIEDFIRRGPRAIRGLIDSTRCFVSES